MKPQRQQRKRQRMIRLSDSHIVAEDFVTDAEWDELKRKPQRQARTRPGAVLEPIASAGTAPRWKPMPQRQERRARIPRLPPVKLPKQSESGSPVRGYRGCELFKGTHVRRAGEGRPGTITAAGREQCEVKWYHTNTTQAEITAYLERY